MKEDGESIHPDAFSQTFDRKVAKLAVPAISLQGPRHTHATLLLKAGVPVAIKVCYSGSAVAGGCESGRYRRRPVVGTGRAAPECRPRTRVVPAIAPLTV